MLRSSTTTRALIALAAAGAVVAAVQTLAATEEEPAATSRLTVSSTAIKGQAGNKLIVLAVGGVRPARLCVDIPSDDFTLPPTVLSEPPAPWNPCGPETPEALLADGELVLRAQVTIPDTRTHTAIVDLPVNLAGDTAIVLDGEALSLGDDPKTGE